MYIVLDGIDGTGKNVQADLLAKRFYFNAAVPNIALRVNEPDSNRPTGRVVLNCIRAEDCPEALASMFLADRMVLHHKEILPALADPRHVISVRSFLSTLVYQQETWDLEWLFQIHQKLPAKIDYLFILDLDVPTCMQRIKRRGKPIASLERKDILERCRQRYLTLAQDPRMDSFLAPDGRIVVLSVAGLNATTVHELIWKILQAEVREDSEYSENLTVRFGPEVIQGRYRKPEHEEQNPDECETATKSSDESQNP